MGTSVFSADNPFAPKQGATQGGGAFSPDNPFAPGGSDPLAKLHADYQSGKLHQRVAQENADDAGPTWRDYAALPHEAVSTALRTGINAIGGGKLLAAGRAIDSGTSQEDAEKATNAEVKQFSTDSPRTALATKALAMGLSLKSLPGKLMQGGRVAGAGVGAGSAAVSRFGSTEHPGETLGKRLAGTVEDAAVGGAVGYSAPWLATNPVTRTALGAGAGAWLAPQGHGTEGAIAGGGLAAASPTLMAKYGSKIPGKFGEMLDALTHASGTRGTVNKEMEGVQRLLTPLGGQVGAPTGLGAEKVAQAASFKRQAADLYDQMRQAVTTDPRMKPYLADPDFQTAAKAVIAEKGLPADTDPFSPDILHGIKQVVRNVMSRKYLVDQPLTRETAARLAPKVESFTTDLHAAYPEAKAADNFFQLGKTAEEASGMGYNAVRPAMRNPGPKALGTKDVAGVENYVATRTNVDPAQATALKDVAGDAARQGARGQLAQQIGAKSLSTGRAGVLSAPGLEMSPAGAEQRGLAMGSATRDFNKILAAVRAETATDGGSSSFNQLANTISRGRVPLTTGPGKALASPEGVRILQSIVDDPQKYQGVLQQYGRGKGLLEQLNALLAGQAGAAVGRR